MSTIKLPYEKPALEVVKLDNEISLALESTPFLDPNSDPWVTQSDPLSHLGSADRV